MEDKVRVGYTEPKWFKKEEKKLADEWLESKSDLDIVDYILLHASEKFKKEYEYAMSFY